MLQHIQCVKAATYNSSYSIECSNTPVQCMHTIVHPSCAKILVHVACSRRYCRSLFLPAELDLQGASSGASFGDFTDAADTFALPNGHQPTPPSGQTSAMSEPRVSGRQPFSQGSSTMPWSNAPFSDGAPFKQDPAMLSLPQASNASSTMTSSWPQQHQEMSNGSRPAVNSFTPTRTELKYSFDDISHGDDGFGDFAAADHVSTNGGSQVQTSQQHTVAAADRSALLLSASV